jgi:flavin-dependent dehydrogenase
MWPARPARGFCGSPLRLASGRGLFAAEPTGPRSSGHVVRKERSMMKQVNVLVVGGGPGGSTAAALLAKAGLRVLLLEREQFPRYHIGESLLASCQSTLKLSGAYDAVAAHGFQIKRGGVVYWGDDEWVLDWQALVDPNIWSWQVDRAQYDELLLRNAARQGAEVIEQATVKRIVFRDGRAVAAEWTRRGDAEDHVVQFDHVIDASGRKGLIAQHLDLRHEHQVFQNVAMWSYWQGAELLPNTPEGGINVVSAPDGWWWHIPLGHGRYSVGLVTHKTRFRDELRASDSLEAYYVEQLRRSPAMARVTRQATQVAPVKVEQDYSYVAERFCGPGYLLVGDAACFLDPLLSTGVHLAQYSGMLAAASIISVTRGDVTEAEGWAFFEYVYRRAYTRMLVLVSRMYERYQGADDYFWQSQKLVHETTRKAEPIRDFTAITTGLTDIAEAADAGVRVLNDQLMHEAAAVQDASLAGAAPHDITALDMKPLFDGWFSLAGADSTMNELALVTEPALGLRKVARHRQGA